MEIKGKIKTPNFWADRKDPTTGEQYKARALVLHITDGSFLSTKRWFIDPRSYASSHYVVDRNGDWWQFVDEKDASWTNGKVVNPTWKNINLKVNPNLETITVEVVNSGEMPSWKQWTSWARGCKDIMKRNHIFDVVNHFEINASKQCPRPWFTRFWLRMLLKYI